mgnify:CR=1 FL=1
MHSISLEGNLDGLVDLTDPVVRLLKIDGQFRASTVFADHPVTEVTWYGATAYAKWVGKRLTTEKEWDWAARGGLVNKNYSWGNDENLARDYANYFGTGGKDKWDYTTAPVSRFKSNGYGLYAVSYTHLTLPTNREV